MLDRKQTPDTKLGTADTVLVPVPLDSTDTQHVTPSLALRGCTKALVGLAPLPAPWADDTDEDNRGDLHQGHLEQLARNARSSAGTNCGRAPRRR